MFGNKKAITMPLEELIKIILAVIGIAALIYLAVSFYGIFQSNARLEQAKANLDEIVAKLNGLKEGESMNYMLLSPAGYSLIGWPLPESKEAIVPKPCSDKLWANCICMCKYEGTYTAEEDRYYLGWVAKLGGVNAISGISNWIEIANMNKKLVEACNVNGVCREMKKSVTVKGVPLEMSWDEITREISSPGASTGQMLELNLLIRVDELMKSKKQLKLSMKGGAYAIETVS